MHNENEKPIKDLSKKFAERGIYALYGGKKGHGFWLYRVGVVIALKLFNEFDPDIFWEACAEQEETPIIRNDGKNSGNPCFWLFRDAAKLAESPEVTE